MFMNLPKICYLNVYFLGGIHLVRTQGKGGRGYDRCVHFRTVGERGLNRCFVCTHNDILGPTNNLILLP